MEYTLKAEKWTTGLQQIPLQHVRVRRETLKRAADEYEQATKILTRLEHWADGTTEQFEQLLRVSREQWK